MPDRLRWARTVAGLSKRALSDIAGLDPSHVRFIEAGERPNPSVDTLGALAEKLGTSVDWLAFGRGEPPTEAAVRAAVEHARGVALRPVGADHTASDFTVADTDPTGPIVVRDGFDQRTGTEG